MKKIKVIIENTDTTGKYEFEFDDFTIEQERGITKDELGNLIPNEQFRMVLKAWSGCKTFEDFVTVFKGYL